jgi:hypothetical protein
MYNIMSNVMSDVMSNVMYHVPLKAAQLIEVNTYVT